MQTLGASVFTAGAAVGTVAVRAHGGSAAAELIGVRFSCMPLCGVARSCALPDPAGDEVLGSATIALPRVVDWRRNPGLDSAPNHS